ncbi:hypothetical protein [Wolbachia endosymbiont of Armadillidium arcangelii]|uniref:Uncharacterized protein n=1 Tax=Wolbachia endosymbiont of Armadillidium arcangelii TaxID=3158571 RepID=A0AAU7Q276_9RICK
MARPKLYKYFNGAEDNLLTNAVEIRKYSLKNNIAVPGKLIGTINHEYGIFRNSADGEKGEFIFSDCTTKGKDVIVTDKDYVTYSRDEGKSQNPQRVFLFLAKYKDDGPCQNHCYSNNIELKIKDYVLDFVKIISNIYLYEGINLEKLFTDNKDLVIEVPSREPDMYDLLESMQCVANPIYADSVFLIISSALLTSIGVGRAYI